MKKPKAVWIIFDACDGPHIFTTKSEANKIYRRWKRKAEKMASDGDPYDTFWDMSEPIKFVPAKETKS